MEKGIWPVNFVQIAMIFVGANCIKKSIIDPFPLDSDCEKLMVDQA